MKYTGILQCIHKVLPSLSSATSLLVLIACPEKDWEAKELTPVTHNALLVQGARRENTFLRTNVSPSASTDIFVCLLQNKLYQHHSSSELFSELILQRFRTVWNNHIMINSQLQKLWFFATISKLSGNYIWKSCLLSVY